MKCTCPALVLLAVLLLVATAAFAAQGPPPPIVGTWTGSVTPPGGEAMAVTITITQKADGAFAATASAPGMGRDVPADKVTFADGTLRLEFTALNGLLEGKLSADGRTLEGRTGQSGNLFPVTLQRVSRPGGRGRRTQERKMGEKYDITYSTAVATPHVKWASKLPGGPIKGFFIPSIVYGRDMVELMQRLDLDSTTVSIDREWDVNCWGVGDFYSHEERGDRDDFRLVYTFAQEDLTSPKPFDVIVIPGLNGWTRLTKPARDAILRRVQEGAGLVLLHPFLGDVENHPFAGDDKVGDTRLWEVSPLVDCPNDFVAGDGYPQINREAITRGKWEAVKSHFITDGIPLDLIPEGVVGGQFYKYRAAGDVLIKSGDYPVLAVKTYGKGRVVSLAYVEQGFMPEAVDPVATHIYWDYWEYQYALLTRCLLWAAGRDAGLTLSGLSATPEGAQFTLTSPSAHSVELEVTVKGEGGEPLGVYREKRDLPAAPTAVTLSAATLRPASGWHGGRTFLDIIVRSPAGESLAWAATSFTVPQRATLRGIVPGAENYVRGQTLTAAVRAAGDLAGLKVRLRIADDMDRLLSADSRRAAAEVTFSHPLTDFFGYHAYLTAELVDANGAVVDQLQAAPVFVATDKRRDPEYAAQIGFSSGRPYWSTLRRRLIYAGGVQTGLTWTEGVNNGLDIEHNTFGIYWYRRGPTTDEEMEKAIAEFEKTGNVDSLAYNTKRELFKRTKDKKFLVRTPCFDDPAVTKDLRDRVAASAKSKAKYNMDYYFVGDEGSLTSYGDPFDFCWSPCSLAGFREWLKTQYGSLEALKAKWKTSFADWKDVVPYTTDEALEKANYAPWADHRTYMEVVFARAYQTVRDAVTEGDPDGHIAVSGTQATNSYNGCDWYRLDQIIDDFLSYGGGNQWDLHRSFAKPGAMIGFWTGYGSSGLGVQNAIWNAALHDVLYPQIFWMFSYLNADFTYSKSARDMADAFKALRFEGVGRLFRESQRQHDGIALHYSMPSMHASSIYLEHPKKEGDQPRRVDSDRDGWVRGLNGLGLQFNFVSYDQLAKGALGSGQYKVFVLPLSVALSPAEAKEIRAFVENGGVVIADAGAGAMDDHCAWAPDGMLGDLFGVKVAAPEARSFTRLPGAITITKEGEAWGLTADPLKDLPAVETLAATAGTPLMKIGDNDAAVVRPVGKGWAIYLNVALDGGRRFGRRDANAPPPPPTGTPRNLVEAILVHLGIRPAIGVFDVEGKPLDQAYMVRYHFGDSEALALLKENVGVRTLEGRDGVTTYRDANLGDMAKQDVVIRLPKKAYVTNVRTGERLGYTDEVKTSVVIGGTLVLGLAPADNTVVLKGPAAAKLGEHPRFALASSRPAKALVRCHVFGPDGKFVPEYEKNVVLDGGKGTFVLPSALSDAAGAYTLKVTDVLTGSTAEAKITLR